jgi:ligand-binding sensor domain-containing protein
MMEYRVELYSAPAGPGKIQPTRETGNWRTYDATDGLGSGFVWDVFQDRDGYIWCTCYGGGVARFDGHTFQKFTTKEGLAHNEVACGFEAADGRVWFGTEGGISVFDGERFETMTTEHGLPHNEVADIIPGRGRRHLALYRKRRQPLRWYELSQPRQQ